MAFNFSGEDSDTMDGFDTDETGGEVLPESEPLVPGTPADYVPEGGTRGNLHDPEQIMESEEEDYEQVLSQVDRRMRVAYFYRSVLDSPLFSEDTSEAKIVQNRIRKFCNDELEVIFGMRAHGTTATAQASQFTPEEAEILKGLAAQVRVAKEAKGKPMIKPTVKPIQPKVAAIVQTIQTQNKPAAPQPKPKPPPASVAQPQAPKPKVPAAPAQQAQVRQNPKTDLRIPERYRNDPTVKVVKGKVYVQARNDDQQPLYRTVDPKTGEPIAVPVPIMRDVTPMAVPTGSAIRPLPMPSVAGGPMSPFSQLMEQQANASLAALDRVASIPGPGGAAARLMGGALTHSITSEPTGGGEYD